MRLDRATGALLASATAVLVAGCGGGSGSTSSTTPASSYVHALCTTISGFEQVEKSGAAELSKLSSASHPNLPQLKAQVTKYFSAEARASEAARTSIDRAGVPDVSNGTAIRTALLNAFSTFTAALNTAVRQSRSVGTSSEKQFATAVEKLQTQLSTSSQGVSSSLDGLGSSLKAAAAENPACSSIT